MSLVISVLIVLGFLLILWLPQNMQHEGLHALFAKIFGAIDIRLYPFPTWQGGSPVPKYWAHMNFNPNGRFKNWQYGLLSCAPQLGNTIIMIIIFTVLMTISLNPVLYLFLMALFIINFIDGSVNLGSILVRKKSNGNDAWSAIHWLNVKLDVARIIVLCWYILMIVLSLFLIP